MQKQLFLISTLCLSAQLFGAADAIDAHQVIPINSGIIKVYTADESQLHYQLAFHQHPEEPKILACLVVDEHLEDGAATETLARLVPLDLDPGFFSDDGQYQYSKIKRTIQVAATRKIIICSAGRFYYIGTGADVFLYLRILNNATGRHGGHLRESLYCKLNSEGQPNIIYDEPDSANETWVSMGGIGPNELAFEVDIEAIKQEIQQPGFMQATRLEIKKNGCSIL